MLPIISDSNLAKQTLVLSACYQATVMVHSIATKGVAKLSTFKVLLDALFAEDNQICLDRLKTGISECEDGIKQFIWQLEITKQTNALASMEATRYMLALISLEKSVSRSGVVPDIAKAVNAQSAFYQVHDLNKVIENLAGIYADHISGLKPRIMVKGTENHLKINNNASRVRTTLLIAIRLIILWRQLGGKRWQLILYHKKYMTEAKRLLIHPV